MLTDKINIGDRIEITVKREKALAKCYISQVVNILDGEHVVVHAPISYGKIIKLSNKEDYSFLFITDKTMTRFDSRILGYFKENNFILMKIKLTSKGERIQRREYFRFACLLPLKFSVISDDISIVDSKQMFEAVIKDVSGGGIRFVSNHNVKKDTKIKCLLLFNSDYLITIAKVLNVQEFPKSVYKYEYRASFIGILPEEQDRIVQFIFEEQRKDLQKFGF